MCRRACRRRSRRPRPSRTLRTSLIRNPSEDPAPREKDASRWWLWLLLLLLAVLLALRAWQTLPQTAQKRAKDEDERLLVWYRALLGLLAAAGLGAEPSESPSTHALRLEGAVPQEAKLLEVADAVTLLGYGRYGASPAQTQEARRCYRILWHALPWRARPCAGAASACGRA